MMLVIGLLLALGLGLWFGRRLGPALVAAVMVMAAPLWLVGGFVLDLLRKLPAGIRWALLALLRALGVLLRALGVLAVLPLTPFVFAWAFLAELFRPKHQPPTPIQSATERTAEVIDLAACKSRKKTKNDLQK